MEFPLRTYWKCAACEAIHFEVVWSRPELGELAEEIEQGGALWMLAEPANELMAELTVQ